MDPSIYYFLSKDGVRGIRKFFGALFQPKNASIEIVYPLKGDIVTSSLHLDIKCILPHTNIGMTIWGILVSSDCRFFLLGEAIKMTRYHYLLFVNVADNWQRDMGPLPSLIGVVAPLAISEDWCKNNNDHHWRRITKLPPGLVSSPPVQIRVTDSEKSGSLEKNTIDTK